MRTTKTSDMKVELDWSLAPSAIAQRADELIADLKAVHDRVGALADKECTFQSVIAALGAAENDESTRSASLTFPQYVSTDKTVRDASAEADRRLREFSIEASMRHDLFRAVSAAVKNTSLDSLTPEQKRLALKMELDFKRDGLGLSEDDQARLKTLKKRLSELQIAFSKNINEDTTSVELAESELDGMPAAFLAGLKKTDAGKLCVTMKYPDFNPVMKQCRVAATRQRLEDAYGTRCRANVALLEEAVQLRARMAQLLGYPTHAAFKHEINMAHDPATVHAFLRDLRTRLEPLGRAELETLLALKREAEGADSNEVASYDYRFYHNVLLEKRYNVNDQLISQYFSLEAVTAGMLDLYAAVLSLEFSRVTDAPVWHEDVQLIEVRDAKTSQLVGQFYLDLHPRDGKYSHAACFGLQPGCQRGGSRQHPVAAMVANFTKASAGRPSLLRHDEVVTYFHELGHVMHSLCAHTEYARFHGTNTQMDFVEAPSQMLENWCWEPQILGRLSRHYETGEPLPQDLVASLCASRNVGVGLFNLRQLFFGIFDMTCHDRASDAPVDTTALWAELHASVSLLPSNPATYPAATFGHLMGGYDAMYFSYLWSQVYSADMFFSRFKREGLLGSAAGVDYRAKVLGPGGSKDGMDLLEAFLSRKPSMDAFLKSLGL